MEQEKLIQKFNELGFTYKFTKGDLSEDTIKYENESIIIQFNLSSLTQVLQLKENLMQQVYEYNTLFIKKDLRDLINAQWEVIYNERQTNSTTR